MYEPLLQLLAVGAFTSIPANMGSCMLKPNFIAMTTSQVQVSL